MPRPLITTYERAARAADKLYRERKSTESLTAHSLRTACIGRGDHATCQQRQHVTAETALIQFVDPFWREPIDELVGQIVQAAVVARTRELSDDNQRLRSALAKAHFDVERLRSENAIMGCEIDRLSGALQ